MEESYEYAEQCPYCGQANLTGEDARLYCGCYKANLFRRICGALVKVSTDTKEMQEIDGSVMAMLVVGAHLIVSGKAASVDVKLEDGTTVKIGNKVSRTAKIKKEEKV